MGLSTNLKVLVVVVSVSLLLLIGGVWGLMKLSRGGESNSEQVVDRAMLVKENSHVLGEGKIEVVEFADFQCPACGQAHKVLKKVMEDYPNEIRLIFRHFPLISHRNAIKAARAAEAAGEQGKFWEMYNLLFVKQAEWENESSPEKIFKDWAEELDLDIKHFIEVKKEDQLLKKIEADRADGLQLGVNSTPTFFVNGKKYTGVLSYQRWLGLIKEENKQ